MFSATSEQSGRFDPKVSDLLFVSVENGDAVQLLQEERVPQSGRFVNNQFINFSQIS